MALIVEHGMQPAALDYSSQTAESWLGRIRRLPGLDTFLEVEIFETLIPVNFSVRGNGGGDMQIARKRNADELVVKSTRGDQGTNNGNNPV